MGTVGSFLAFAGLPDYTAGMNETGKNTWILKKSYEIAYAVFRIAATMDANFAGYMKNSAISLLGAASRDDYAEMEKTLSTLQYFTRFAMDVSMLGINNAEILLREMDRLDASLGEVKNEGYLPKISMRATEIDLSKVFTEEKAASVRQPIEPIRQPAEVKKNNPAKIEAAKIEPAKVNPANPSDVIRQEVIRQREEGDESGKSESGKGEESGNGVMLNAAMRQSAILELIRQIGNCRVKDIEDILPGSSERTIRYDLQTLMEQNLVERVGAGGPSVYYRIRLGEHSG